MDVTTETLSPTRVKLTISVPFAELEPSIAAAYKKVAQSVRVPGFRPGKVPARIIDQRVGRASVLSEALDAALPELYGQAVRDKELTVLSRPEVDVTGFGDGIPLEFTAEVDVRPEITLPAYDSIAVEVEDAEVTEADVTDNLTNLRERVAEMAVVERAAAEGDVVVLSLVTTLAGEPVEGAQAEDISHEVGGGGLVPGLDQVLVGMAAGDERTFTTELQAGDAAGQTADVGVMVSKVSARELPELDDALAQQVSQFATLADLTADVRTRLERVKRMQQGISARDKILEALVTGTEVPLPAAVVQSEVDGRKHEVVHQLNHDDALVAEYLQQTGKTDEEWTEQLRGDAEQAVRAQLVLDAVADAEEIGVSQEELTQQLVQRAMRSGMAPDQYAQQLVEQGAVPALATEVRRGKALATVLEAATITDASGRKVDLSLLDEGNVPAPTDDPELAEDEAEGRPDITDEL